MFTSHSTYTHIGSDNNHREIWHQTDKAKHGGFKVLLMTTEVKEGHNFRRLAGDMSP
jgi:hypothetical protein